MATITAYSGFKVYTIKASDGSGEAQIVPDLGANVSSLKLPWKDGLRETLYLHPFYWERKSERTRGGFPFIFPICGRLERDGEAGVYLYEGVRYKMANHGFSMRVPWNVTDNSEDDSIVLSLRDNNLTLNEYPFPFEVRLRFRIAAGMFTIEQDYINPGKEPIPYYAGFHPYFATPAPGQGKERVKLDYRPIEQWTYNNRLTDIITRDSPPSVPSIVSDSSLNEKLTRVGLDKEVRLIFPEGHTLHVCAEGIRDRDMFPFVQLYTMPDRPFFCVEHWMGFPNAMNTVKGCRWLGPATSEQGIMRVWTSA